MKVSKSLILVVVLLLVIGAAVGAYFALWPEPQLPPPPQTQPKVEQQKKPVREDKQFVLAEVGGSGVAGDGTATLKDDLSSIAVRLIRAADLKAGESYEVYAIIKEGTDPQLVAVFAQTDGKNEKFLTAGAGLTSWYVADKLIVTRRGKDAPRPGTVLAETSLAPSPK